MIEDVGDFTIPGIIIIITAISWLALDIWLYLDNRKTISQAMFKMSKNMMAIAFILGFIMGHWFW